MYKRTPFLPNNKFEYQKSYEQYDHTENHSGEIIAWIIPAVIVAVLIALILIFLK